ncbi:unnamed protein product [Schistocephalus solidus]|uniref:C2H2-type domain-containing protein n=1 Tax=Schistocephalus solidus TaxID=70667 RepID=A0A183SXK2_SCHSO|nr:unnamed protein product [Schistocephalus solidus]
MLMDAYRDEQPGIRIAYRTKGHLLNSRRMQAPTRVSTTKVHDLLFADDCALNTVTEEDMQRSMDLFAEGCVDFGLTISTAKTVVNAPVAVSNWYPALTCGSSKLGLPSGHTKGNRHDWRVKPGEGVRCCVCASTPVPRTNNTDAQALLTCTRCQRIFRALLALVGHLRTQCTNNPTIPTSASNSANPPSDSPTLTPGINSITPTIIETTSQYSSPVTPTTATTTAAIVATTITTTTSDVDYLLNCP